MPTEENQTTTNPVNSDGSNQSNPSTTQASDGSTNPNIFGDNQKIDTLDIDLNLDGLDLPLEKTENTDGSNLYVGEKIDNLDLGDIEKNNAEVIFDKKEEGIVSDTNSELETSGLDNNQNIVENNVVTNSFDSNDLAEKSSQNEISENSFNETLSSQEEISQNQIDNANGEMVNDKAQIDQFDPSEINEDIVSNNSEQIDFSNIGDVKMESDDTLLLSEKTIEQENDTTIEQENDWLLEEDKKIEEILSKEQTVVIENDLIEKDNSLLLDTEKMSSLDLPFVSDDSKNSESVLDQGAEAGTKVDDLSDLFSEEESVQENQSKIEMPVEEVNQNINIQNENVQENKIEENSFQENNVIEGSNNVEIIQNTNEPVVQNNQGDLISDTGEFVSSNNDYIPNENEFKQVESVLNSDQKGEIDLSSLENVGTNNDNLDLGTSAQDIGNTNQNNSMNIDSLISSSENILNIEDIIQSSQIEPIKIENENNKTIDATSSSIQTSDVVMSAEQMKNNVVESQNSNTTAQVVDATQNSGLDMNLQNIPNNVQVVSSSEFLNKKNSHSGIKIFVLIVLLLVGGFMIISKMYPEEIKEIMSAIKNGNQASIEYSDNADMGVVLNESGVVLTGDLYEEDEIDPNSLAGQLEMENVGSGDLEVSLDETISLDGQTGHGAADFNAFEELDNVLENNDVSSLNADLLENLRGYLAKGNEFNAWGRENNPTAMKYGLYIANYAEQFINDIESGNEIDKFKIDGYIVRFDSYIERLNNLRNNSALQEAENILQNGMLDNGIEQSETQTGTEF